MKFRWILVATMVLNLLSPTIPASAIFGLSKCEKVKKEIVNQEAILLNAIDGAEGDPTKVLDDFGISWERFLLTIKSRNQIKKAIESNPIHEIWKLSYNNPSCFTNSQKLQIKKLSKLDTSDFVSISSSVYYQNTPTCKNFLKKYFLETKPESEMKASCPVIKNRLLGNYVEYKSLYSY